MAGFWDGYNSDTGAKLGVDQGNSGGGVGGFFAAAPKVASDMVMGGVVNPAIDAVSGIYNVAAGQVAADTLDKVRQVRDKITQQHKDALSKLVDVNNPNDKRWDSQAVKDENSKFAKATGALDTYSQNKLQPALDTSQKVDVQKTAAGAATTALNLLTLGTGSLAKGVGTGVKTVLENVGKEAGSNALLGAGYGASMTASDKNATIGDYAKNMATGGVIGGVMGAGFGAITGPGAVADTAAAVNRTAGLKTSLGQVAAKQELSTLDRAQTTAAAAHMVDQTPPGLVVNGDVAVTPGQADINPFNQPEATNTQLPPQDASIPTSAPVTPAQMPITDLAKAAQMENPAMPSVPPTITPGAKAIASTPKLKVSNPDGAVFDPNYKPVIKTEAQLVKEAPVVSVVRKDGTREQYKPKTLDEWKNYERQIDGKVAGTPDANGDVWHISASKLVQKDYNTLKDAPTPAFDGAPQVGKTPVSPEYVKSETKFLNNTDSYMKDIISGKSLSVGEKAFKSKPGTSAADSANEKLAMVLNDRRKNGTLPDGIDGWLNDLGSVPDLDGMGKLPFSGDLHTYHAEVAREAVTNELDHLSSLKASTKTPKMSDSLPKPTNIGAEITPGQNILEANITMTDAQVKQATDALQGLSKKKQVAGLKAAGATEKQMRDVIGVDSNGITLKPMEVVNQGKKAVEDINKVDLPKSTAEEIAQGTPKDLNIQGLNKNTIDFLDKYVPKVDQTTSQKINKAISAGTNTIQRATETLGSFGADVSQQLVKAQKVSSDLKISLRPSLQAISKQSKKMIGDTQTSRTAFGKKLNNALENRTLGDKAFTTQAEKDIYNNTVKVLDAIKVKMQEQGIPVRDNYTPYQMMKDYGESADYLSRGLTDAKTRVESGHVLPRNQDSRGKLNNENILDLLPNYANGMIDHLAFTPVMKAWEEGIGKVPASIRRNTVDFNDGVHYMNRALSDMVNRSSSSLADKAVQGLGNAYYRNALYMNPKNAMYAQLQKLQAVADTTSAGRKAVSGLSKDMQHTILKEHGWFHDLTVSQDAAAGASQAKSNFGKFLQKTDVNRASEASAVHQPTLWGFADEIIKSDVYKTAKSAGKTEDEAFRIAMKDPQLAKQAEISGNMVTNNTMFGANSAARPEILRGKGVIKKAFGMFQRFPLAESNFVKQIFTAKDTRVLDVLQTGDPRKVALGESRMAYNALATRLKDAEKAIKGGAKIKGAPDLQTLGEQIAIAKDAVKKLDAVIKQNSNIKSGQRASAFAAMWVASGAVSTMWDGALNYGNPGAKSKTLGDQIMQQDPTIASKVAPWMPYSVAQSGLTSPLIPFNRYGPSAQGALNLVPGAGVANRLSGKAMSTNLGNWLKGK